MFSKTESTEAVAKLHEFLRPGDRLACITKHVSRSGMSRLVAVYVFRADPTAPSGVRHYWLSRLVAKALRWPYRDDYSAVRVDGCGMDMHFHLADSLSYAMFGEGGKLERDSF